MRFKDKVVLVTGGNSGIGFATAKRLVSEGATVIITGRDKKRVDQSVQELGAKSLGIVADVTKTEDIDRVYSEIKSKFGKLDGLFANAGVATFEPITQITEKSYDNLMNTNVKGVFFTLQKAIPLLSKGASIVINSSVLNTKGSPGASVYGSTKAAVRSLARSFSSELVGSGVRAHRHSDLGVGRCARCRTRRACCQYRENESIKTVRSARRNCRTCGVLAL
jgi:NAD(P)-dependent dehydrogenase (short-subunit alcohol dehydrogenase family)